MRSRKISDKPTGRENFNSRMKMLKKRGLCEWEKKLFHREKDTYCIEKLNLVRIEKMFTKKEELITLFSSLQSNDIPDILIVKCDSITYIQMTSDEILGRELMLQFNIAEAVNYKIYCLF